MNGQSLHPGKHHEHDKYECEQERKQRKQELVRRKIFQPIKPHSSTLYILPRATSGTSLTSAGK